MKLSRRHVLRGAGGVAIALPFLGAMEPRLARAATGPKRFVAFFTGLGTVKDAWTPAGTETDFTLGEILQPLAPVADKIVVVSGLDMVSTAHGPGDPHQTGIGHALTGTELLEGNLFPYACNPAAKVGWGGGVSIDQFFGDLAPGATKFKTLEFGVQVEQATVSSRLAYKGPDEPVPPEDSPYAAFERIFTTLAASPEEKAYREVRRQRVLDAVLEDYRSLNGKLGGGDRAKLEAHLGAVESIESTLHAPGALGGNCQLPILGEPIAHYENDNYPIVGQLQLDLLAMALACDLTRSASIQWSSVLQGRVFSWLGQTMPHHTLSHQSLGNAEARQRLVDIGNWHASQLAYFAQKLATYPEGDGTVLDNTVILWCTDVSMGQTHAHEDMPYVLVGGAGGAWETGRHVTYAGKPHNDLLVSICHAMGAEVETFGNPAYCTGGPLPGLG